MASDYRSWIGKLGYIMVTILFVGIGLLGLILPVIPGLVFLGLALLMTSRLVPSLERWLRRYPLLDEAHEKFHRYQQLPWRDQCKVIAWSTVRAICDTLTFVTRLVNRLVPGR